MSEDKACTCGHSIEDHGHDPKYPGSTACTEEDRGKSLHNIMRQGRWKNERVAQSYIRPATIFVNNATDGLGDEPEKKR